MEQKHIDQIRKYTSNKFTKITGKGWVENPSDAAFYNKAQGERNITNMKENGLKVVDGIKAMNAYKKK